MKHIKIFEQFDDFDVDEFFEDRSMGDELNVGDRVIKNEQTWIPTEFDSWGRGEGIGVIVEPPFGLNDNEVDVRWVSGRCFEFKNQLIKV